MIETVMYEFDGIRWVPVARAQYAECGHVHWFGLGRHRFRTFSGRTEPCSCWRGDR